MNDDISAVLEDLIAGRDLGEYRAAELLRSMADGRIAPEQTAALLVALRIKGENGDEIRGFAKAMHELALRPPIAGHKDLVDCVGTGGDGSGSLNLSTGAALLAAACGAKVVKHGNRAVSSRSGSADVLEALGFDLPRDGHAAAACIDSTGFTFLFAPHFHAATRVIAQIRKSLGVRTVFNFLGPLTNPARPPFLVIGACTEDAARIIANALTGMAIKRAFVIHGAQGWDEATPLGPFLRLDVRENRVRAQTIDPACLGMPPCRASDLAGGHADFNAAQIVSVLQARDCGAHRDALTLGAGLVLEVSGLVDDLRTGIDKARAAIARGDGYCLLQRLRRFTMEAA